MAITSTKSGATGISLALDNNFMEPIASTLVGAGGVKLITFTDIPQGYKHLQLRATPKVAVAVNMYFKLNGDASTTNYIYHYMYGDGATPSAGWSSGVAVNGYIGYVSQTQPAAFIMDILDYTNTNKNKTIRTLLGVDGNGAGNVMMSSALWLNTAAIDKIEITSAQTIAEYSRFSLYGIKG
jgi:hypothetical protein